MISFYHYYRLILFFLLISLFLCKIRKVHISYPIELLAPIVSNHFEGIVSQNKLTCFSNRDYIAPTYTNILLCMLQYYGNEGNQKNCHTLWGSRSVVVEVNGSVEFLKFNRLPHESNSFTEYTNIHATRWLELTSLSSPSYSSSSMLSDTIILSEAIPSNSSMNVSKSILSNETIVSHRKPVYNVKDIKQIPCEPIYLCARSNDWMGKDSYFQISFRPGYVRTKDKELVYSKAIQHFSLIFILSSVYLLPYIIAYIIANIAYTHAIPYLYPILCFSIGITLCTPYMLTKRNRHFARHYIKYFFTRIHAIETKEIIQKRLIIFQAVYFSSLLICIGITLSHILYTYYNIDRNLCNMLIKTCISIASLWLSFSICRSFERFCRDWIWIGLCIGYIQYIDTHMNSISKNEIFVSILFLSFTTKTILSKILQNHDWFKFLSIPFHKILSKMSIYYDIPISRISKLPIPMLHIPMMKMSLSKGLFGYIRGYNPFTMKVRKRSISSSNTLSISPPPPPPPLPSSSSSSLLSEETIVSESTSLRSNRNSFVSKHQEHLRESCTEQLTEQFTEECTNQITQQRAEQSSMPFIEDPIIESELELVDEPGDESMGMTISESIAESLEQFIEQTIGPTVGQTKEESYNELGNDIGYSIEDFSGLTLVYPSDGQTQDVHQNIQQEDTEYNDEVAEEEEEEEDQESDSLESSELESIDDLIMEEEDEEEDEGEGEEDDDDENHEQNEKEDKIDEKSYGKGKIVEKIKNKKRNQVSYPTHTRIPFQSIPVTHSMDVKENPISLKLYSINLEKRIYSIGPIVIDGNTYDSMTFYSIDSIVANHLHRSIQSCRSNEFHTMISLPRNKSIDIRLDIILSSFIKANNLSAYLQKITTATKTTFTDTVNSTTTLSDPVQCCEWDRIVSLVKSVVASEITNHHKNTDVENVTMLSYQVMGSTFSILLSIENIVDKVDPIRIYDTGYSAMNHLYKHLLLPQSKTKITTNPIKYDDIVNCNIYSDCKVENSLCYITIEYMLSSSEMNVILSNYDYHITDDLTEYHNNPNMKSKLLDILNTFSGLHLKRSNAETIENKLIGCSILSEYEINRIVYGIAMAYDVCFIDLMNLSKYILVDIGIDTYKSPTMNSKDKNKISIHGLTKSPKNNSLSNRYGKDENGYNNGMNMNKKLYKSVSASGINGKQKQLESKEKKGDEDMMMIDYRYVLQIRLPYMIFPSNKNNNNHDDDDDDGDDVGKISMKMKFLEDPYLFTKMIGCVLLATAIQKI